MHVASALSIAVKPTRKLEGSAGNTLQSLNDAAYNKRRSANAVALVDTAVDTKLVRKSVK